MHFKNFLIAGSVACLITSLSACSVFSPVDRDPEPAASEPHEAFEQVGEPEPVQLGPGRPDPDGLSSDIERLQDAKRKYEHDKAQEGREVLRRQQACAEQPDSEQVPIQGGGDGQDSYCQEAVR